MASDYRKVSVNYGETVCKNYQSKREDFGFEVQVPMGSEGARTIKRAKDLCRAVVKSALGVKIGARRKELDGLAEEFFDVSWDELATGIAPADEVL